MGNKDEEGVLETAYKDFLNDLKSGKFTLVSKTIYTDNKSKAQKRWLKIDQQFL